MEVDLGHRRDRMLRELRVILYIEKSLQTFIFLLKVAWQKIWNQNVEEIYHLEVDLEVFSNFLVGLKF